MSDADGTVAHADLVSYVVEQLQDQARADREALSKTLRSATQSGSAAVRSADGAKFVPTSAADVQVVLPGDARKTKAKLRDIMAQKGPSACCPTALRCAAVDATLAKISAADSVATCASASMWPR